MDYEDMKQISDGVRAKQIRNDLVHLKQELDQIVANCNHDWKVRYDPIITGGYQAPGDPPGTMGIDWRGPYYIPRKETPRWFRTCSTCGHEEETRTSKEEKKVEVKTTPVFSSDRRR